MNESFESDEQKRREIIGCLYHSLMYGWDIPKDIREHYGFSEDYELYHRLESLHPQLYRQKRLQGEIPDVIEVEARLAHTVEKIFERLCIPAPIPYLDRLYEESDKLVRIMANPKMIDDPFIYSHFLIKYGIDRNASSEIRRQQAEKAYKDLQARFEIMTGRKSAIVQKSHTNPKEYQQPSVKEDLSSNAHTPLYAKAKGRKMKF